MPNLPSWSIVLRILSRAALAWNRHDASSMGAAIAFYALVSLPPVIAVTLATVGFVLDPTIARDALTLQIQMLWGADAAATAISVAHYAVQSRAGGWAVWVAVVVSLVTASTVFVEMRRSLDVIWGEGDGGAILSFVQGRLIAFAALLVLGVALWVSVLLSALLAAADSHYLDYLGVSAVAASLIGNGMGGVLIMVLLAALYKLLPQRHVAWREAWCGAFVVAALYLIGKEAIAFYLGHATVASGFGGGIAGALIVLLLWFYYSAQIFLYGAEISHEVALERQVPKPGHKPG